MTPRYQILYDFGDKSHVTGWLLLKDGIVLSKHKSWEAAKAAMGAGE